MLHDIIGAIFVAYRRNKENCSKIGEINSGRKYKKILKTIFINKNSRTKLLWIKENSCSSYYWHKNELHVPTMLIFLSFIPHLLNFRTKSSIITFYHPLHRAGHEQNNLPALDGKRFLLAKEHAKEGAKELSVEPPSTKGFLTEPDKMARNSNQRITRIIWWTWFRELFNV